MGSCGSSLHGHEKKVVIVGASFAGLTLAELLWDFFEVLIIDRKDYYEHNQNSSAFLVDGERFDSATLSYNQIMRNHGKNANFVQGNLEKVDQT